MILLTGANGVVGKPLGEYFWGAEIPFIRVTRSAANNETEVIEWNLETDADNKIKQQLIPVDTLVHCAPIWLLPKHLQTLSEIELKRLVVFSSTSVISKQKSTNIEEQNLVNLLKIAEQKLNYFCSQHKLALTIFRPSMIYGYGRDQNVMQIAGFIKRFGFMLLAGKAEGLRQPVHCDDLVNAVVSVLDKQNTFSKTYTLSGGEKLSYRAMVNRIFIGLGLKPKVILLPISLYRLVLRFAALLTSFSYTAEMATRMQQDLIYTYSDAAKDFSYAPQNFLEQPTRDLVFNNEHN